MIKKILLIAIFLQVFTALKAQRTVSADSLFKNARQVAFEDHDYAKARQLSYAALNIAPAYPDIQVFLGRIHTWTKQYDSARYYFENVLVDYPTNEEAGIAYTDLEYWNEHYGRALIICDSALKTHPASESLLLRKARILNAQKQYEEAGSIVSNLLSNNKNNAEAIALASTLKNKTFVNKLSISYDHTSFNKQYSVAWRLASLGYSRQTKYGSYSARLNYANRFNNSGVQGEVDAYPRISKTFYSYVNFGYAATPGVFPKYKAGLSLFANLPHSLEAEAGIRYLYFDQSTHIYTLYLGKYYKSFLFSARTYLVPSNNASSQSYNITGRYYFKDADDYVGLSLGTGISPDDNVQNVQFNAKQEKLTSKQISAAFNHTFLKRTILSISAGLINSEYQLNTKGNQVNISFGLSRRF